MNNNPNSVRIDLSAVAHNLCQVRTLISKDTKIMGIVKSDAYGHGLIKVSQTLEKNGIDCLGVACLHEALELREKGIKVPIVILCGIQKKEESRIVVENNLTPVLFDLMTAEILDQESARQGKKTKIHLEIETGMGRLGISHEDIVPFIKKIMTFENLDIEALTSHLSSADERESDFTEGQIKKFEKAIDVGRSLGLHTPLNNLANSAGIMGYKRAHFNMVRPGIMLYGCLPSSEFKTTVTLKPAMCFKGRILQVKDFPDKTPVSYGRTHHTAGERRLAVLSAGYGDGIPRSLSNRGSVLVRENRVPIVGVVCMNLTICDITGLSGVKSGEEVVFLGTQGREDIIGDDIAGWAGTLSYEILCSVGQRNKKEYIL